LDSPQPGSKAHAWHLDLSTALFVLLALAVIAIAVYVRIPMLHFFGFYEPDGYYHFSVIRAAVNNHFIVPEYLGISGWPQHTQVTEPFGLYWITLVPYFFLQYVGVSYYTVMRLISVVFGIFDVIGAYLLSRYLSKDRLLGLLVMLFVALNMGNAARTSALIYRGDSFVIAFLIVSLIFAIEIFRTESRRRKLLLALGSGLFLALCDLVWNGGSFATAVYVFAFALIVLFGFTFDRKKMVHDCKYLLAVGLVFYLFIQLFMYSKAILTPPTFSGMYFLLLLAAMAAGWLVANAIVGEGRLSLPAKHKSGLAPFLGNAYGRAAVAIIFILVVVLAIYLLVPSFVYAIFNGEGFFTVNNFSVTIQEAQSPTPQFIFASFSLQTYMTPMGIMVLASTYEPQLVDLFWSLLLLTFIPYLFMRIYDSKGFAGGKARVAFDSDAGMLTLVSFFALTAYLQMQAIRFNALLSVPLSIFAAFTVYWLVMFYRGIGAPHKARAAVIAALLFVTNYLLLITPGVSYPISILSSAAVAIATFGLLIFEEKQNRLAFYAILLLFAGLTFLATLLAIGSVGLTGIPGLLVIILLPIIVGAAAFAAMLRSKEKPDRIAPYVLVVLIAAAMIIIASQYMVSLAPADNIDPQFIQAMSWMRNGTLNGTIPSNSVVLTLWPDGSVVEGVANLTSVTDSVGSQNGTKCLPFAAWLFNSSPDPQFLTSSINGAPDYLVVRSTWMLETGGIYTESELTANASVYGYNQFTGVNEKVNSTTQIFAFSSPPPPYGSNLTEITELQKVNGGQTVSSYLAVGNERVPFAYVEFYNEYNGNFSVVSASGFNKTNNQTFLIVYSTVPSSNLYVNVTGAYLLSAPLASSNMIKFLYVCNDNACAWNNNYARLQMVYINPDTKIFRIIYNQSAQAAHVKPAA